MFGTYYGVLHVLLTLFHTRLFHGKWRLRIIIARNVIQLEIYNAIDLGEKRLKRLVKIYFPNSHQSDQRKLVGRQS